MWSCGHKMHLFNADEVPSACPECYPVREYTVAQKQHPEFEGVSHALTRQDLRESPWEWARPPVVNVEEIEQDLKKIDVPVFIGKEIYDWDAVIRLLNAVPALLEIAKATEQGQKLSGTACKQCGKASCSGPPGYDYNCDGSPRNRDSLG